MTAVSDRHSINRIVREQAEALQGFTVLTVDGEAGKVAKAQDRIDEDHLVVHVDGFLGLFGSDVVVENEAIDTVDTVQRTIHVDRITDWVKSSPTVDQYTTDHATT